MGRKTKPQAKIIQTVGRKSLESVSPLFTKRVQVVVKSWAWDRLMILMAHKGYSQQRAIGICIEQALSDKGGVSDS